MNQVADLSKLASERYTARVKLIIIDCDGVIDRRQRNRQRAGRATRERSSRASRPSPGSTTPGIASPWLADQSAIARGQSDMATLNATHARTISRIEEAGGRVDLVVFRPSAPESAAGAAAVLAELLERLQVPAPQALIIGDSQRDVDAAQALGCPAILVLTGNGRRTLDAGQLPATTVVRVDLAAVAAELAP